MSAYRLIGALDIAAGLIEAPPRVAGKGALGDPAMSLGCLLYRRKRRGQVAGREIAAEKQDEAVIEHVELYPHLQSRSTAVDPRAFSRALRIAPMIEVGLPASTT